MTTHLHPDCTCTHQPGRPCDSTCPVHGTAQAPFRIHEDVAVVEYDADCRPLEGGQILPATVTEAGLYSVTARFADGEDRMFLLDSRGRAWRLGGRWRLVRLCTRCDEPATTPVKAPGDPLDRTWCSEGCLTSDAEGAHEQRYQPGVAT